MHADQKWKGRPIFVQIHQRNLAKKKPQYSKGFKTQFIIILWRIQNEKAKKDQKIQNSHTNIDIVRNWEKDEEKYEA